MKRYAHDQSWRILMTVSMKLLVLLMAATLARPASSAPLDDGRWASLADRLFPAIEAIQPKRLSSSATSMLAERKSRIHACAEDSRCTIQASHWSDSQRRILAEDAASTVPSRGNGYVVPDDGVRAEADRQLIGLNDILDVYGLGLLPRYPEIDGPGEQKVEVSRPSIAPADLRDAMALASAGQHDVITRLDPSIGIAIALLDASNRDQSSAFELLDQTYNAAAFERARSLDWSRFPFNAIIVPGMGPNDLRTPLSAGGKLRVLLAAERYTDGAAPFILLSGSAVHPRGTRFVEAQEMRKELIERFHIPENAILLEPYARHTTTNLRNASRRLFAIRAPADRDSLIVTDKEQSFYIESPVFKDRNLKELGYMPGAIGKRHSSTELVFRPSISSLRVDPADPLDP